MKRAALCFGLMILCTILAFFTTACSKERQNDNLQEVTMKTSYSQEDFDSIVVGESTYQDVYNIAPCDFMQVASYGGMSEHPLQSGGCIRIQYYGKDLIVGKIELIR